MIFWSNWCHSGFKSASAPAPRKQAVCPTRVVKLMSQLRFQKPQLPDCRPNSEKRAPRELLPHQIQEYPQKLPAIYFWTFQNHHPHLPIPSSMPGPALEEPGPLIDRQATLRLLPTTPQQHRQRGQRQQGDESAFPTALRRRGDRGNGTKVVVLWWVQICWDLMVHWNYRDGWLYSRIASPILVVWVVVQLMIVVDGNDCWDALADDLTKIDIVSTLQQSNIPARILDKYDIRPTSHATNSGHQIQQSYYWNPPGNMETSGFLDVTNHLTRSNPASRAWP